MLYGFRSLYVKSIGSSVIIIKHNFQSIYLYIVIDLTSSLCRLLVWMWLVWRSDLWSALQRTSWLNNYWPFKLQIDMHNSTTSDANHVLYVWLDWTVVGVGDVNELLISIDKNIQYIFVFGGLFRWLKKKITYENTLCKRMQTMNIYKLIVKCWIWNWSHWKHVN